MTPPLPGRYDSTSVALDRLSEGTKKNSSPVSGGGFHTARKACRFQNIPATAYCFSACF